MSRENVEVVRAVFDALASGDTEGAAKHVHPQARVHPGIAPVEQGRDNIHGRQGVKQFFDSLLVWKSRRVEFKEVIDARDRLVIVESWHFRGSEDIDLDFDVVDVYRFRGGLIFEVDGYVDREEALEAVGLQE